MNERQRTRAIYRIPMLLEHIARAKKNGQADRADNFQAEYDRRINEVKAVGGDLEKEVSAAVKRKKAELTKGRKKKN